LTTNRYSIWSHPQGQTDPNFTERMDRKQLIFLLISSDSRRFQYSRSMSFLLGEQPDKRTNQLNIFEQHSTIENTQEIAIISFFELIIDATQTFRIIQQLFEHTNERIADAHPDPGAPSEKSIRPKTYSHPTDSNSVSNTIEAVSDTYLLSW
jgi:hypothetical protein